MQHVFLLFSGSNIKTQCMVSLSYTLRWMQPRHHVLKNGVKNVLQSLINFDVSFTQGAVDKFLGSRFSLVSDLFPFSRIY